MSGSGREGTALAMRSRRQLLLPLSMLGTVIALVVGVWLSGTRSAVTITRENADLLPPNGRPGGQWNEHPTTIDGILWVLADGGRWRNLPEEFGPWQSVYDRFRRWARNGLWDQILRRLQARKMRHGDVDWE